MFEAAYAWVELADFVPAFITGNLDPDTLPRGICAAGHKAMYNDQWGGLPSEEFLAGARPGPGRGAASATPRRPCRPTRRRASLTAGGGPEGRPAGRASPWPSGAFDAHMGAVGAGIKPGTLVKIIGTSTCDMMVAPMDQPLPDIPGLCGIVPGSIVPGMYGLEAGQSAVGDIFNWFVKLPGPGAVHGQGRCRTPSSPARPSKLRPGESGLLALDWNNGNRTILVDPLLTGLLVGQTLHTTAPEIYRALVEATAFGALTIINRFEEYGVDGQGGGQLRRHRREEPVRDADLRRRLQPADEDQPLGADLRPGGGDLRRRGRRGVPDDRAGPAANDRRQADGLPAQQGGRRRLRRAVRALPHAARRLRRTQWPGERPIA